MATSSITANFYTDDPKAANAIVHALFTNVKPSPLPRGKVKIVRFKSDAEKRLFMEKAVSAGRQVTISISNRETGNERNKPIDRLVRHSLGDGG